MSLLDRFTRRKFLGGLGALGTSLPFLKGSVAKAALSSDDPIITKTIPKSGEQIPAIGMGTWITFNVEGQNEIALRRKILQEFFDLGGGMIDSSPMYGSAPDVLGRTLPRIDNTSGLFSASKVWTPQVSQGADQLQTQLKRWNQSQFDLMQVHNLLSWEGHLKTLKDAKANGLIRYIGITTSHGRRHAELEDIMKNEDIDFVQLTYNLLDREAEERLLPLAQDKGIAVIANRPFQRGALIRRIENYPLPEYAADYGIKNWPQFLLKFIISHPAVTVAIPAVDRVDHLRENMMAIRGALPDAKLRQQMIADYNRLLRAV